MMLKLTFLLALTLCCNHLQAQNTQSILDIPYDKVIAYEYTGGEDGFVKLLDEQGKPTEHVKKQVIVDAEMTSRLNQLLVSPDSYGGVPNFCFEPRMGFIYFKEGQQVFRVDICLECQNFSSSKKIPASEVHWAEDENGNKTYALDSYSYEAIEQLEDICTQLGFSHCK